MDNSIGCELSASAASNLRKAIKCLLTAGVIGSVLMGESAVAQQLPDDKPPTTLPNVQAQYDGPRWSAWGYSPYGYSFHIDGVRVASGFLGEDTEGYDQPDPAPP